MLRILILLIATLTIAETPIAQGDTRPMTPLDVAQLKYVGDAVLAEDGDHIAYTVRVQADPLKENLPASYELHLYDLEEGVSMTYLTRGSVRSIAFRPEHNTITFLNNLDNASGSSLYEIPMNGGEAQLLATHETSIGSYEWTSDGKKVLYVAREKKEETSELPYQPEVYEGELLYNRLWVMDAASGDKMMLDVEGHFQGATWSPDGSRILGCIAKSPLVDDYYMERRLKVLDSESGEVLASIDHEGKKGDYCWSPDGEMIAFIAGADKNDPIDGRLWLANADGGQPVAVNLNWRGAFEQIEWTNDGTLYYLASMGAESVHGTVDPESMKITESIEAGFSIGVFDVNDNGAMAMVAATAKHPPELFYRSGSIAKKLTTSNPWLSEIAFGKQQVIRYKAKDGLEIEGILIYPTEYEEGEKYPLLVGVHGGPEAHIDNGWVTGYSYPGQVAAGKGYAVFYPNYRGSTGRGLDYTLTSQADPAGKEFDDIVDGVDHLVEIGLADADRVGVTGGSYGGYATGWLSTKYTDKFAGGVMFVGISNKVSKWGTTDIPNEEYLVHARKWVYEDYDFFLKRSPIYYAGQCETPLLIMHGKEDPRVHPSQSMELYRHVKSRTNTPVELIFYPGEGHGNRRATARYDYNLRMLSWFDKYVKGEDKS